MPRRQLHRRAGLRRRRCQEGDDCAVAGCHGRIGVYSTFVEGDYRIRYLACKECGDKPPGNKRVIPLEFAPGRRRADRR